MVKLELKSANGKITRPIAFLYPLELHCDTNISENTPNDQTGNRLKRSSAIKALQKIRNN